MKNLIKILIVAAIFFSAEQISAQDTRDIEAAAATAGDKVDASTAILQVANGIKPEAFKNGFDMTDWKAKLPELDMNDFSGMKSSLTSLLGGLKGSSFAKGAKSEVLKKLSGLNGNADIAGLLGSLVNGLKPEMLTKEFATQKDDFLEGLKMMK